MNTMIRRMTPVLAAALLTLVVAGCEKKPSTPPGTFDTPEQAAQAMGGLLDAHDPAKVEAVFGPGSVEMFKSGDDEADAESVERLKAMMAQKVGFEDYDETTKIVLLGEKEWPWPIPLVQENGRWRFDTAKGKEELLNRRVGTNELSTLASLHELVEAQREYRSEGRDGNPPAYAGRIISSEGKHDGLYWPPEDGQPLSPLGDLVANSDVEAKTGEPYHGYRYKLLRKQGPNAPGGEKDYADANGLLTNGFAVLAWPAKHGNSGVMSFLMNERGIVFQKDLGADTETAAAAITAYDPDASWTPETDAGEIETDEDDAGIVEDEDAAADASGASADVVLAAEPGAAVAAGRIRAAGTITGVDKETREVTIKGDGGREVSITAGDAVKNFDQLAVGDRVEFEYMESLALELKKGEKVVVGRMDGDAAAAAEPGEKPAGVIGRQVTITAEVVMLDPETRTVGLMGPKRLVELQIQDPEQFALIAKGDHIQATYTEAVAIAVSPAPAEADAKKD